MRFIPLDVALGIGILGLFIGLILGLVFAWCVINSYKGDKK